MGPRVLLCGRLKARLCLVQQRSKAPTCSPPLVFHTTVAVMRSVRAAKAVLFQAGFTGAVTHRTVVAHHTSAKR
jgi:hypothetical protein